MRLRCGALTGGLFMSACFCMFAVIFGALIAGDFQDYLASGNWNTASGEVISSTLQSSTDSEGDTTYRAYVTYFYFAGDERLENDRVSFGDSIYTGSRDSAQETLDKYSPGTSIEVYYDPNNPLDAVIERNLASTMYIFGGVACLGVFISIGALLFAIFRMARGVS